jgi:hypothetical protein
MIAKSSPFCQWPCPAICNQELYQESLISYLQRVCSKSRLPVVMPGRSRACDPGRGARLGLWSSSCPAPGGIARPASGEPPAPVARSLFTLFYLVEIRHQQLLQLQSAHPLTLANAHERVQCENGKYMVVHWSNARRGNAQQVGRGGLSCSPVQAAVA